MVSLFTLGVSFLAAVFFACGGYWNMLLGAVLSLFASILDGCDGEVARLKLLESDFGCWLETICDYLYYLFIYAGMAIGLAWSSGNDSLSGFVCLFFFGAILIFVISFMQRQRLTNGRPEQLLEIWQKKAESRPVEPAAVHRPAYGIPDQTLLFALCPFVLRCSEYPQDRIHSIGSGRQRRLADGPLFLSGRLLQLNGRELPFAPVAVHVPKMRRSNDRHSDDGRSERTARMRSLSVAEQAGCESEDLDEKVP